MFCHLFVVKLQFVQFSSKGADAQCATCRTAASTLFLVQSLMFLQCAQLARIYTRYSYIRVFEEKCSYFTRIFVIYSYFWAFWAHSTRCELFEPVKSYGNDSAILKQSKNMLLNFELHRSTMNFELWTMNLNFEQSKNMLLNFELHKSSMNFELHRSTKEPYSVTNFPKINCWFTHLCRKNVAIRIYALFKNKNSADLRTFVVKMLRFEFTRFLKTRTVLIYALLT